MIVKYKKLTETKNLFFLWVEKILENSRLTMEDGTKKIVKDVVDFDSITHVFRIKFEDGDIMLLSDKDRYVVEVPITITKDIETKPNKKRKRFKRYGI